MLSWKRRDGETAEAQRRDGGGRDVIPLFTLWPALTSSLCQVSALRNKVGAGRWRDEDRGSCMSWGVWVPGQPAMRAAVALS